jgi:hypothetical protein
MSVSTPFSLRVRLGHCEVEISGSRDEVLQTIKDLPNLITEITEAFAGAGVEVSNSSSIEQRGSSLSTPQPVFPAYPSIPSGGNCSDAVLKLLETDWGRATPRTLPELIEAMKSNAVHYPATTLSGVLNWLVRKGRVKRWKTEKGYVYVLAAPNAVRGPMPAAAHVEAYAGDTEGE